MTPLDLAFVAANTNADKQNEFYTLLLNSTDDGGIFSTEIIKTIAPFYVRR